MPAKLIVNIRQPCFLPFLPIILKLNKVVVRLNGSAPSPPIRNLVTTTVTGFLFCQACDIKLKGVPIVKHMPIPIKIKLTTTVNRLGIFVVTKIRNNAPILSFCVRSLWEVIIYGRYNMSYNYA